MSGDGDVLDTLVKQSTDPLACLRELPCDGVTEGESVVSRTGSGPA
jgi:hypothetical protein